MLNHYNTWKPNTCNCIVVFGFDDELPIEEREHVAVDQYTDDKGVTHPTTACQEHIAITDPGELYQVLLTENNTSNLIYGQMKEDNPELTQQMWNSKAGPIPLESLNPDFVAKIPSEEITREYLPGQEPVFTFQKVDGQLARETQVAQPSLTDEQIAAVKTKAENKVADIVLSSLASPVALASIKEA